MNGHILNFRDFFFIYYYSTIKTKTTDGWVDDVRTSNTFLNSLLANLQN